MSEPICTCHCGGSMFYRHLHSDSCELSRVGEEAPMSPKNELQALRDEVARLRTALEQAGDDICSEFCGSGPCHKKCMAVQAALTPQGGGKSCAHPRTHWYSGQYEKTLECLDCRAELDERKL